MGKSIRAKIKKRLRTAKRQRVDAMLVRPREEEHYASLQRTIEGRRLEIGKPKNAFKYPKAADAVFPQHEVVKPIDFRAESMPMVGYVFRGNRRKYDAEEAQYLKNLASTHPKMEVMAGGGVVLAATGQKVTALEAELLAGALQDPEKAASASRAPTAAAAVAAAVAADQVLAATVASAAPRAATAQDGDASMAPGDEIVDVNAPGLAGSADHTRRPVLKDSRRLERAAAHRPRAKKNPATRTRPSEPAADSREETKAATPAAAMAAAAPVAPTPPAPSGTAARQEKEAASQDQEMPQASEGKKVKKKTKKKAASKASA
jgi:hypothetical protein